MTTPDIPPAREWACTCNGVTIRCVGCRANAAVAAEREACARVAESVGTVWRDRRSRYKEPDPDEYLARDEPEIRIAEDIAAMIRARKEVTP